MREWNLAMRAGIQPCLSPESKIYELIVHPLNHAPAVTESSQIEPTGGLVGEAAPIVIHNKPVGCNRIALLMHDLIVLELGVPVVHENVKHDQSGKLFCGHSRILTLVPI